MINLDMEGNERMNKKQQDIARMETKEKEDNRQIDVST